MTQKFSTSEPTVRSTRRLGIPVTGVVALLGLVAVQPISGSSAGAAAPVGMFSDTLAPTIAADTDRTPVELGVKFTPQQAGSISALQYYQGPAATGVNRATLWSPNGTPVAQVTFPSTTKAGWRTVALPTPVKVSAGATYVASYFAPKGAYPTIEYNLLAARTANGLQLPANAGVYRYATEGGFPTSTYRATNYLVDVLYTAGTTSTSTTTAPTTTSTTTTTTTVKPTTSTATPTATPSPTTPAATSGTEGWKITTTNVGLAPLGLSCASLPVYTGPSVVPAGTTISNVRVTSSLDLSRGGITIQRSCIQPTSVGQGMPVLTTTDYNKALYAPSTSKVVIRDSEIDGSKLDTKSAALATGFIGIADLVSNYVHGFGSGLAIMNAGSTLDARVEHNYVTGLVAWGDPATTGNHSDAFTVRDFTTAVQPNRQLIVQNNRFNASSGSDTGAFFIQTYSGQIGNLTIQGNLLEGNGYQLGLEAKYYPYSNVRALDNRFSGTGYGATYRTGGPGWSAWSSNYIFQPSATNAAGAVVSQP